MPIPDTVEEVEEVEEDNQDTEPEEGKTRPQHRRARAHAREHMHARLTPAPTPSYPSRTESRGVVR